MGNNRKAQEILEENVPGLFARIESIIKDSERKFTTSGAEAKDSFLWEHTLNVVAITRHICAVEEVDPLVPVIAALFHDSGKFLEGKYHEDGLPEEDASSSIALDILTEAGMEAKTIVAIRTALDSLYREGAATHPVARIIHDADFLAKSGYLGIASFFIKSALRGKDLIRALSESLSRELTYNSVLKDIMYTAAGKQMASVKMPITRKFFTGLLEELEQHGISRFEIRNVTHPCPGNPGKFLSVTLVLPRACPECEGKLDVALDTEKGIKCTRLSALVSCRFCHYGFTAGFCLPELSGCEEAFL